MTEARFQLHHGILLGLGIALVLIGFFGWLTVSYTYGTLKNFFLTIGYDPNSFFLFRDLTNQIAIYLTVVVTGVVALTLGALGFKSRVVREFFYTPSMGPHVRLGSGLIAVGATWALISMHHLFLYILASDYLQLEFSIVVFLVGVFLLACGILAVRHK